MQISNISSNKVNFKSLSTHCSFYDKAAFLSQNKATKDVYEKAYKHLDEVSGKKNLEIRELSDWGGVVVETDEQDNIVRYVAKNFQNAIQCMKDAALILEKENAPQKPIRKRFQGNI